MARFDFEETFGEDYLYFYVPGMTEERNRGEVDEMLATFASIIPDGEVSGHIIAEDLGHDLLEVVETDQLDHRFGVGRLVGFGAPPLGFRIERNLPNEGVALAIQDRWIVR